MWPCSPASVSSRATPTAQVVEIVSRLRDDEPRPSLTQEEALANAPAAVDGFFRVPAIQEEA